MSGDKTAVTAHLDDSECRRLERFMDLNGHGNPSNAARKAINRGVRDWERGQDPSHSWLLNIGFAASLWAVLAVIGYFAMGVSWVIPGASVVMALVFLTAHAVQIVRQRWAPPYRSGKEAGQ